MAHIYEKVVKLISKAPEERNDREVDLLIPWFQNMSGLFKAQKTDVVKDIVRNCDFRSIPADSVIIKQGDKGDCFYIILSGSVSVYINQKLEEHDNVAEPSPSSKARRRKAQLSRPSTRSRSRTPGGAQLRPPTSSADERVSSSMEQPGYDTGFSKKPHECVGGNKGDHLGPDESKGLERKTSESIADSGCSSCAATLDENDNEVGPHQLDDGQEVGNDVEGGDDSDFDYFSDEDGSAIEETTINAAFDRKTFGVHIRELGAGKCFGELALVQTNLVRTASIVTDRQTNLLVIERELYNRSLKAAQQLEFDLKKTFVTTFPLFRNWTPRQRNVMAMSLTRYQYQFDNTIARQGAPVTGIHFITRGSAMVTTDTIQHVGQYPDLTTEKDVQFAKDVKTGRGMRISHPLTGSTDRNRNHGNLRGGQHCIRRKETYAQAERIRNYKNTDVCVIGEGDYVGDMEVILRLSTYGFSVKCLQSVDSFELDLNNFERQIVKKNPTAYALMRETALTKLRARVQRLQKDEQLYMPILERMLNKLSGAGNQSSWKKQARSRASFSIVGTDVSDAGNRDTKAPLSDYRENQRRFLRRRQREKDLEDSRNLRLAHAVNLGRQLEKQNMRYAALTHTPLIPPIESRVQPRRESNIHAISNGRTRANSINSQGEDLVPEGRIPRKQLQANRNATGSASATGRKMAPRSIRELADSNRSSTVSSKEAFRQDSKLLANRMKNVGVTQLSNTSAIASSSVSLMDLNRMGRARPASALTHTRSRPRVLSQTLPQPSRPSSSITLRLRSFSVT